MGRRRQRRSGTPAAGSSTAARESLERGWRDRMEWRPDMAGMVTAAGARHEPFHRWIPLAQGFSPELVRLFLSRKKPRRLPILDPFSGSGTVVMECARQGVRAMGVEAAEPLVFLTTVMANSHLSPLPALDDCVSWQQMADRLEFPLHRAALLLAIARQHTSAGKLNKNAASLAALLPQVVGMMRDDLRRPLSVRNLVLQGDARRLDMIADGGVAGILTSPPYLSRHDYTQILRPYATVYRHWYPTRESRIAKAGTGQLRAYPAAAEWGVRPATGRPVAVPGSAECGIHESVTEAGEALADIGESRLARLVTDYFDDIRCVLVECARVLHSGAPCWLVIGGARLKGVYVPSDLIAAELAERCGLRVAGLRVARNLIDVGRKLGKLGNVAPRESILVLQKP